MDLPINYNRPLIMHVDLNSCYAMIEQQANPLIRHKPVAIAAYDTPRGAVIAASYEAKALGIKLGVNVREARMLDPNVIVLMPDPDKYFDAHRRFKKVLLNYTDNVIPKSIDEFVIDFSGSVAVQRGKRLEDIGYEIKAAVKEALGEYVTINVGIGTNRFLAKLAAGLHKPDGLDVITGETIRDVYSTLDVIDLPGINTRYQARLNIAGIFTPLQFLDAQEQFLHKLVFKSIEGTKWYLRLRGHEADGVQFGIKSYGQQYALGDKTTDREQLSKLLMKLCHKTGRRMRKGGYMAGGIYLWLSFEDRTFWHRGKDTKAEIYSTQEIYLHAQRLLNQALIPCRVTNMGVTVYKLRPADPQQMGLFDGTRLDTKSLARAEDIVNDKFGEFTMTPATMANMQNVILKRVPFGSVRDL